MKKADLIYELKELFAEDPEHGHREADKLLLKFIGDPEVAEAYNALPKWYS